VGAFIDAIDALNPVAWYKCDEASGTTLNDSSGNGYHGAYFGTVDYQSGSLVPLDTGCNSFQTDGTAQYAYSATNAALDLTTDHTIIYVASINSGNYPGMRNSSSTGGSGTYVYQGSGNTTWRFYGNTYTAPNNVCAAMAYSSSPSHFVAIRSSDGATRNGWFFVATGGAFTVHQGPTASVSNASPWYLGKNGTNAQYQAGRYGPWAYFNSALSDADIYNLASVGGFIKNARSTVKGFVRNHP